MRDISSSFVSSIRARFEQQSALATNGNVPREKVQTARSTSAAFTNRNPANDQPSSIQGRRALFEEKSTSVAAPLVSSTGPFANGVPILSTGLLQYLLEYFEFYELPEQLDYYPITSELRYFVDACRNYLMGPKLLYRFLTQRQSTELEAIFAHRRAVDEFVRLLRLCSGSSNAPSKEREQALQRVSLLLRGAPALLFYTFACYLDEDDQQSKNLRSIFHSALEDGYVKEVLDVVAGAPGACLVQDLQAALVLPPSFDGTLLHLFTADRNSEKEVINLVRLYESDIVSDSALLAALLFKHSYNTQPLLEVALRQGSYDLVEMLIEILDKHMVLNNRLLLDSHYCVTAIVAAAYNVDVSAMTHLLGLLQKHSLLDSVLNGERSDLFHLLFSKCNSSMKLKKAMDGLQPICAYQFVCLLQQRDQQGFLPFHRALAADNYQFFEYLVSTLASDADIARAILPSDCMDELVSYLAVAHASAPTLGLLFALGFKLTPLALYKALELERADNFIREVMKLDATSESTPLLLSIVSIECQNILHLFMTRRRCDLVIDAIITYGKIAIWQLRAPDSNGKTPMTIERHELKSMLQSPRLLQLNEELKAELSNVITRHIGNKSLFDIYLDDLKNPSFKHASESLLAVLAGLCAFTYSLDIQQVLTMALKYRSPALLGALIENHSHLFANNFKDAYGKTIFDLLVDIIAVDCVYKLIEAEKVAKKGLLQISTRTVIGQYASTALDLVLLKLVANPYNSRQLLQCVRMLKEAGYFDSQPKIWTVALSQAAPDISKSLLDLFESDKDASHYMGFDKLEEHDLNRMYHGMVQHASLDMLRRIDTMILDIVGTPFLRDPDGMPTWWYIFQRTRGGIDELIEERLARNCPSLVFSSERSATLLHWTASRPNSYRYFNTVLYCFPDYIDKLDAQGCTALHWAVETDCRWAVYELLTCGANPNVADGIGRTPLHIAAERASDLHGQTVTPVMRQLLDFGADMYAQDSWGRTPADIASLSSAMGSVRRGPSMTIELDRSSVVYQLFIFVRDRAGALKCPWHVVLRAEIGADAGGLLSEIVTLFHSGVCGRLGEGAVPDDYILFESDEDGTTLLPKPRADPTLLRLFGQILAHNFFIDSRPTGVYYSTSMFIFLWQQDYLDTGKFCEKFEVAIARDFSPRVTASLQNLLDDDVDEYGLEWDFVTRKDEPPTTIAVTNTNKQQYVYYVLWEKLLRDRFESLYWIRVGFRELMAQLLPESATLPEPHGFYKRCCGLVALTGKNLAQFLVFENFPPSSKTPQHLMQLVEHDLSVDYLRKLLQFVCAFTSVPANWLASSSRVSRGGIKIARMPNSQQLPVAHTCFCRLDLPDYNDASMLKDKLLMAIEMGLASGFQLA